MLSRLTVALCLLTTTSVQAHQAEQASQAQTAPQSPQEQKAAEPSAVPPLPADVPADAVRYTVLMAGNKAGAQAVWTTPDSRRHVLFQYNDRGRGPQLRTVTSLDAAGVPVSVETTGVDYYKGPVTERFRVERGVARWENKAEKGQKRVSAPAFYPSLYGPPDESALLARFLLRSEGQRVALLPEGEARLERMRELPVQAGGRSQTVTLYAITGFWFSPAYLWLDTQGELFASGGSWSITVREGWEGVAQQLIQAQDQAGVEYRATVAKRVTRKPSAELVLRNVNVFDAESGKVRKGQTVVVRGNRIVSVGTESATTGGAEVIDGRGGTLLPGLWDMHAHVSDDDGLLNLAAGVTTVRDLANDTEQLEARRKRFDSGEEAGPRIIAAGFMDGPGPFQGPTKVLVATEQEGRAAVARYAELGYPQIKIYSSIKPELVPHLIDEAHKRQMRVSGHVPATLFADELVKLGVDELQHINFIVLNFLRDVTETRNPARFTEPGKRAASLDLRSPQVKAFIQLLRDRKVVVDPTLATFESSFVARPGKVDPSFAAVAQRLPTQLRRGLLGGGLPVDAKTDALYKRSYAKMVELTGLLHRSGVQLVAGTDTLAGFGLHRELELYVRAGIPAPEVLQIATLQAARVMKRDGELGSITPGKLADLVLVDGDPTRDISSVRKTRLVIKDGALFESAKIHEAIGVQPLRQAISQPTR
ncbi:MAG: amidohydrolase family protein [Myxococcaceae bacterium]|nr:amidohydrolase family protein [Myxococcaceae bacterium]